MKGLDGLQGPIYVGTGCVFRRQALYGYDAPAKKKLPSKTCNCWPNGAVCAVLLGKAREEKRRKTRRRSQSSERHQGRYMHLRPLKKGLKVEIYAIKLFAEFSCLEGEKNQ